jgi:hypothetical protein
LHASINGNTTLSPADIMMENRLLHKQLADQVAQSHAANAHCTIMKQKLEETQV